MATKSSKSKSTKATSGRKTVAINGRNYKEGSSRANAALASGGKASTDRDTIHSNSDALRARISSKSNADYAAPNELTSADLAPTAPFALPTPPTSSMAGSSALMQMAGLANAKDTTAPATTTTTTPKPGTDSFADTSFQEYLKSIATPPSTERIYDRAERDAGVQEKQSLVNTYQNQLNAIVSKAQADKLSLIGQGRGVTEAIIGGQQAQIDREAAIRSLPVAAQLTAAQGDLEMAKSHLETLFSIRKEDALNKYNHKTKLAETIFNYADKKQQAALSTKMKDDDRAFQLMTNDLNYAQSLSTAAINNGQSSVAARIMSIDPTLPGYRAKLAEAAKGIYVAQNTGGGGNSTETERQAQAINIITDRIQPGKRTPTGLTILNPDGNYINPEAWKEMVRNAPGLNLTRKSFIDNFANYLYIDPATSKPSPNYGLTPKEIKDLGYE
jgi:hypothetical protein